MRYFEAILANNGYIRNRFILQQAVTGRLGNNTWYFIPIKGVILDPQTKKRKYSNEYFIMNGIMGTSDDRVQIYLCSEYTPDLKYFFVDPGGRLYEDKFKIECYQLLRSLLNDDAGTIIDGIVEDTNRLSKDSIEV